MRLLTIGLLILCGCFVHGQDRVLYVFPSPASIKINGAVVQYDPGMKVETNGFRLTAYKLGFELLDTTFVEGEANSTLRVKLNESEEHKIYRQETNGKQFLKTGMLISAIAAPVFLGDYGGIFRTKKEADEIANNIGRLEQIYTNAAGASAVATLKDSIRTETARYDDLRKEQRRAVYSSIGTTVFSASMIYLVSKLKMPKFIDNEKVRFEAISLNYGNRQGLQLGASIRF